MTRLSWLHLTTFLAAVLTRVASTNLCSAAGDAADASSEGCIAASSMMQTRSQASDSAGVLSGKPGAPWSQIEALAVKAKMFAIFSQPNETVAQILKLRDRPAYECTTGQTAAPRQCSEEEAKVLDDSVLPNAAKFLRLGFNSCVRYKDGTGGCNGCLEFKDMFHRYEDAGDFQAKDGAVGFNNNLAMAADALELVYTQRDFPDHSPKLPEALKDTGKSRADLWAFAALAAVEWGIKANDALCDGQLQELEPGSGDCTHIYRYAKIACKSQIRQPLRFMTGRIDGPCPQKNVVDHWTQKSRKPYRDYETGMAESHPDPNGNGDHIYEFFKRDFDFSGRDTVAIMGAHSFGRFHAKNTRLEFAWTSAMEQTLNNQYYRNIGSKESLFVRCDPARAVGGPQGTLAQTGWFTRPLYKSRSGGPFMWFHYYTRCPDCHLGRGALGQLVNEEPLDKRDRGKYNSALCCDQCDAAAVSEPSCIQTVVRGDSAMNADMGIYYNFTFNPATGQPGGCVGFPEEWDIDGFKSPGCGKGSECGEDTEPNCDLNERDTGGSTTMRGLVELYADEQDTWLADFFAAIERMLSNGYRRKDEPRLVTGPWVFSYQVKCERYMRGYECRNM